MLFVCQDGACLQKQRYQSTETSVCDPAWLILLYAIRIKCNLRKMIKGGRKTPILTEICLQEFEQWIEVFNCRPPIQIRKVLVHIINVVYPLHAFKDASMLTVAAFVCIKTKYEEGRVPQQLVAKKSCAYQTILNPKQRTACSCSCKIWWWIRRLRRNWNEKKVSQQNFSFWETALPLIYWYKPTSDVHSLSLGGKNTEPHILITVSPYYEICIPASPSTIISDSWNSSSMAQTSRRFCDDVSTISYPPEKQFYLCLWSLINKKR